MIRDFKYLDLLERKVIHARIIVISIKDTFVTYMQEVVM